MASAVTNGTSQLLAQVRQCGACGAVDKKLSICSQCHLARYCDQQCQRNAWPAHKSVCLISAFGEKPYTFLFRPPAFQDPETLQEALQTNLSSQPRENLPPQSWISYFGVIHQIALRIMNRDCLFTSLIRGPDPAHYQIVPNGGIALEIASNGSPLSFWTPFGRYIIAAKSFHSYTSKKQYDRLTSFLKLEYLVGEKFSDGKIEPRVFSIKKMGNRSFPSAILKRKEDFFSPSEISWNSLREKLLSPAAELPTMPSEGVESCIYHLRLYFTYHLASSAEGLSIFSFLDFKEKGSICCQDRRITYTMQETELQPIISYLRREASTRLKPIYEKLKTFEQTWQTKEVLTPLPEEELSPRKEPEALPNQTIFSRLFRSLSFERPPENWMELPSIYSQEEEEKI